MKVQKGKATSSKFPDHLLEEIFMRSGLQVTTEIAEKQRFGGATKQLFEKYTTILVPMRWENDETKETFAAGKYIFIIYSYDKMTSIFSKFGKQIKKIEIDYSFIDEEYEEIPEQINENIIVPYKDRWVDQSKPRILSNF